MNKERFYILLDRYILGEISIEEREELSFLLDDPDCVDLLDDVMRRHFLQTAEAVVSNKPDNRIQALIHERIPGHNFWKAESVIRRMFPGTGLYRWAAAIVCVLLITGASYFFIRVQNRISESVQTPIAAKNLSSDIGPGGNKAILTLGDGAIISLDDSKNGQLVKQGSTNIVKVDNGQLEYQANNSKDEIITYNTLATPRGGQFQLILPDKTKVWLNAASSIKYPTVFSGKERKVEITGEAYFEVSHNTRMPFKVKVNESTEIEVLGTHFNVNSYDDEATINTTLLEGSVKISNNASKVLLTPGQQAQIKADNTEVDNRKSKPQINVINNADLGQVTAWKDGIFNFHHASLQDVMRQFSRWYDINVVFENEIPDIEFGGKMGRDVSLSKVLFFFKGSDLKFRIEEQGKRLIVTQ